MSIPLPSLPVTHPEECIVVNADDIRARDQEIVATVLAAAAKVLTEHQIPVGNSAAGELACQWTYDALKECRDGIRALEFHHE